MDVLERLGKLRAMAQSPEVPEARTAAKMAVDMIRREGLRVVRDAETNAAAARIRDLEAQLRSSQAEVERLHGFIGEQSDVIDDQAATIHDLAGRLRARPADTAPATGRARILAKFAGTCRGCRGAVAVGEPVYWKRGEGAVHERCAIAAGVVP